MLKASYQALNIMLLLVLLFLFRNEAPILESLSNYASVIILIIGFAILLFWWKNKRQKTLNREMISIYRFWMIMLAWFFMVPIVFFNVSFNIELFYQGMYHDYRYLLFATLPFIFITNSAKKYYDKIFKNLGNVALVGGCLAILIADKSFSAIAGRTDVFTTSYYLWWIVMLAYPYLFLDYYYNRKSKSGLYLIILHFILSLLFLKRAGFIDGILLISFALLFSKNSGKSAKFFVFVFFLMFLTSLFFNQYIDLLMDRFIKDSQNLEEWDRISEVDEFFKMASPFQLFTGFGANNYLKMYYVGVYDKGLNSMHIGAYNILYKGGFLYISFIIFVITKIISLYKYINHHIEIKIGFILGLIFIISFTYEQGWSYVPAIFFTLLPIYRAIYLKNGIKLKQKRIFREPNKSLIKVVS